MSFDSESICLVAPDGNAYFPLRFTISYEEYIAIFDQIQIFQTAILKILYSYNSVFFTFGIEKKTIYDMERKEMTSKMSIYIRNNNNIQITTAIKLFVDPSNFIILHCLTSKEKFLLLKQGPISDILFLNEAKYISAAKNIYSFRMKTTSKKIPLINKWHQCGYLYYHFAFLIQEIWKYLYDFLTDNHSASDVRIEYFIPTNNNSGEFWLFNNAMWNCIQYSESYKKSKQILPDNKLKNKIYKN